MPLIVAEQRSQEWLDARKNKITASNAAAVLGVDPNHKELWAYNAIMGITVGNINQAMQWGIDQESRARSEYEILTGNLVYKTGFWICDLPDMNWLGASPDGLIDTNGMAEYKCPQNALPTVIPVHHAIQCRVQMIVCNRAWVDYFAWHPTGYFLDRIERDGNIEVDIIHRLHQWYETYIVKKTAPPRTRKKKDH